MIVRPTRPAAAPAKAAKGLAQQNSDFTAEGAPPAGTVSAPPPAQPTPQHGPAPRKRWLRERR